MVGEDVTDFPCRTAAEVDELLNGIHRMKYRDKNVELRELKAEIIELRMIVEQIAWKLGIKNE